MKFEKIECEIYPNANSGDLIEIHGQTYQVIGFTDQGTKLLIQRPGEHDVFKLVKKAKKEVK